MDYYNKIALFYAEKYGIIDYKVVNGVMTYKEVFATEGTYLCEVDLDTLQESRKVVESC